MTARAAAGCRRIIANLDAESDYARAAAGRRRQEGLAAPRAGDPRLGLGDRLAAEAAVLGTALRAFARDGDRLWTPVPVDAARVPEVPGLPPVRLEAGPPGDLEPAAAIFAWAETEAVAAERLRGRAGAGAADPPAGDGVVADLVGLLWSAPAPSAAAAARANDKTFSLAAQDSLGLAIPGSRIIASPAELRAHLESGGTDASPRRRWVLKAPFSAAGRLRVRGEGSAVAAADAKRIERLLALQGLLVFEPWLERTAEFGCAAIAREDAVEVIGIHGIETSARGGFRAASIPPPGDLPAGLTSGEENLIAGVARRVGERLAAAGYRGPFGIDCWKHVEASGEERLHLLGEINARMTFGMVARVLAARLRAARVLTPGARARLVADPGGSGPAPAAGSIPIVLGAGGRPSLWIEG